MKVSLGCIKHRLGFFCIIVLVLFFCVPAGAHEEPTDYSIGENWAYEGIGADKPVDLFIVAPTVDFGTKKKLNIDIADATTELAKFDFEVMGMKQKNFQRNWDKWFF